MEIVSPKELGSGGLELLSTFEGATIYGEKLQSAVERCPRLSYESDPSNLFFPIRLRENTEYQITVYIPKSHSDCNIEYTNARSKDIWPFLDPRLDGYINILQPYLWQEKHGNHVKTLIPHF